MSEKERGISLIELLVTMLVLGILSAIVVSLFLSTTKSVALGASTHQNTSTASNVMNEVSRVIRSGTALPETGGTTKPAFVAASTEKISMYSFVDADAVAPKPVLVELAIDSTTRQLTEKRWAARVNASGFWFFDSASVLISTRTLPGQIVGPGSSASPVFTFLKADQTPLPFTAAALTTAQLAEVASVRVTLSVRDGGSGTSDPVMLTNTVGIPNLTFGTP